METSTCIPSIEFSTLGGFQNETVENHTATLLTPSGSKKNHGGISLSSILIGIVLYAIVLVTIVGNALVLLAVGRNKRLQTVFNMYIVNLAITDISVALTAMSFYTTENVLGYWPFGEFMCGVWIFFDYGMTFASVFTLLAISVDRFWSVRWSVHYRSMKTRRTACIGIAITWIAMLILWLPPCITDRVANSTPGECIWEPSKNREFVIVVAVIGHHGSCAVILFCYLCVFLILRKRTKVGILARQKSGSSRAEPSAYGSPVRTTTHETADPDPETLHTTVFHKGNENTVQMSTLKVPQTKVNGKHQGEVFTVSDTTEPTSTGHTSSNERQQGKRSSARREDGRMKKEYRAFLTLSYIVGSYIVCWVPFHVVFDVSAIRPDAVPELVYTLTFWMTYINSTVNPILYNFSSPEFRRAFWEICRIRR